MLKSILSSNEGDKLLTNTEVDISLGTFLALGTPEEAPEFPND